MSPLDFLSAPSVPIAIIEVLIGLFLLSKAADLFVDGAVACANAAKLSPVVVGAVVVGFGTSAPELLVSGIAAFTGESVDKETGEITNGLDVALGNIVGSNVANITLVLGVAALVVPLLVSRAVMVREAPISLAAVSLFAFFTIGGLALWEGVVMLVVLVAILSWIISGGKEDSVEEVETEEGRSIAQSLGITLLGLTGTVIGAQLMVWGAVGLAAAVGLSGGFVGFTLIAIGTSLPELVTAVAAARKGETELILGNLLGSNMFNSLAVGGVIAIVGTGQFSDRLTAEYGVVAMVVVAVVTWVFMVTRRKITRLEAGILLSAYVFVVLLISDLSIGESIRDALSSIA